MIQTIKKYSFLPLCALAFFIPLFPKILPWIIAVIILFFLMEENIKSVFKRSGSIKFQLLFMTVYFVYLTGMLYSENQIFGWNDLGMKLSLLLFPVLLSGEKTKADNNLKWVLPAFVTGSFFSAVILIVRALYLYFFKGQNAFFYESFSVYFHPTYLALYLDFAIAILLLGGASVSRFPGYLKIFVILVLSSSVVLISSKAGLLGLVLVFLFSLIVLAVSRKKAKFIFLLVIILSAIYFILNIFMNPQQNRFRISENILSGKGLDKTSAESSMSRIFVWKSCIELIKAHPVFGVGTGDIKDELIKLYQQNGITGALAKRLNAHNQFLQTAVALGFVGFLVLTASLFFPLVRFFILKEWLYVIFLLLIIFNFLFESMLERQDGIIFFAFFNSLLFYTSENKIRE
jgi:O-antigen ligase